MRSVGIVGVECRCGGNGAERHQSNCECSFLPTHGVLLSSSVGSCLQVCLGGLLQRPPGSSSEGGALKRPSLRSRPTTRPSIGIVAPAIPALHLIRPSFSFRTDPART